MTHDVSSHRPVPAWCRESATFSGGMSQLMPGHIKKRTGVTLTQNHRSPEVRPPTPPRAPCWSPQPPRPGQGLPCGGSEGRGAGHTGTEGTRLERRGGALRPACPAQSLTESLPQGTANTLLKPLSISFLPKGQDCSRLCFTQYVRISKLLMHT